MLHHALDVPCACFVPPVLCHTRAAPAVDVPCACFVPPVLRHTRAAPALDVPCACFVPPVLRHTRAAPALDVPCACSARMRLDIVSTSMTVIILTDLQCCLRCSLADLPTSVCAACDAWRGLPSQCENPYSSTAPTPNPSSISNPTPMTTHPPRPGPSSLDPSPTSPITPSIPAPFWLLYSASGDWQDTQALPLSHWPLLTQRDSTPPSCRSPPASATAQQASASTSCTGAGSCDAPNLHEGQVPAAGSGGSSLPAKGTVMLAFSDPCNLPGFPGWPLRNALLMVAVRWGLLSVQVCVYVCVCVCARVCVCVCVSRDKTNPAIPYWRQKWLLMFVCEAAIAATQTLIPSPPWFAPKLVGFTPGWGDLCCGSLGSFQLDVFCNGSVHCGDLCC
eukprot:1138632-Pelagomonas_calceolata.AAC.5